MKKSEKLEKDIEKVLGKEADKIEVSPVMFSKIKAEIIEKEERGMNMKKLISKKRISKRAGIILGLCIATAVVAAPLIQQNSYISMSGAKRYKEFAELEKVVKKIGITPKYLETLPNGFYFEEATLVESYIDDESGKILEGSKKTGVSISYTKDGVTQGDFMSLSIEPITEVDRQVRQQLLQVYDSVNVYEGITLNYESMAYKFVPEDYELTEADIKAQEDGDLAISVGSTEVEMSLMKSVLWEDNGLSYILTNSNYDLSEDEMLDIAKAIIDSDK
ncbi:MAG: hypothetical protein RR324_08630 [Cellulosilyticaceae bacterium]